MDTQTKSRSLLVLAVLGILLVAALAYRADAVPLGTAFTYQGQVQLNGVPANGACDLQFSLWDAAGSGSPPTGGNQLGTTQTVNGVGVSNGVFTVQLNDPAQFGVSAFSGDERWLQISVSCPASGNPSYTTLSPRQRLTATPNALYAVTAGIASSVTFNYAGSSSAGGPAADVSFPYADSTSKAGPANGLVCNGCVDGTDVAVPFALSGDSALPIVSATNSSTASGAYALHGHLTAGSPGGSSAAVAGLNDGTNGSGFGVYGTHGGGGTGVFGSADSGEGVAGSSTSGRGVQAFSNSGVALVARGNTGNLIEAYKTGRPDTRKFYVANNGAVFADGSYNCGLNLGCFNTGQGADVAERIDTKDSLHPGDLVEIDPSHADRYRLAGTAYSTLVAGVVSTNPGVTMNNNDLAGNGTGVRSDDRPLLALVGKVPVKVSAEGGPIHPGDLLVSSSTLGHAMKAPAGPPVGTIVGKALESLESDRGVIKMLVMLR